jgi:hypothetical protein
MGARDHQARERRRYGGLDQRRLRRTAAAIPTAINASPKGLGGELRAIPQGRTPVSESPGIRPASLADGPLSIPASDDPPSLALAAPTTRRLPARNTPATMRLRHFVTTEDTATVVPAETCRSFGGARSDL